jgi:site-specific recombinase XerD
VDAYRRDLASLGAFRSGPVGDATVDELERWLAEMRAAGLAPATLARRVSAVRTYFRHLVLIGMRDDNPAASLKLPRRTRRLPRALSPSETERLIDAATGSTPRTLRDRALVELLYGAGLRVSEAVGLEKSGVDLDTRVVRVLGKGGKERLVPLGRPVAEAVGAPGARPGASRPTLPAGALPQRPWGADASRRVPHPPSARGEGRPGA